MRPGRADASELDARGASLQHLSLVVGIGSSSRFYSDTSDRAKAVKLVMGNSDTVVVHVLPSAKL